VFSYFDRINQDSFLKELTDEETRALMSNMKPDDRTALLEELPGQITQKLLNLLSGESLAEARALLGYPEDSIGRLMTPDYVAVRPDWTIGRTIEHVRKMGRDMETIDPIYVTDSKWKLSGVISLRQVILSGPGETIETMMQSPVISVSAFDDREVAALSMERYDLTVLPVVDSDGVLVGIVTADDVLDVAMEEATEDIQKGAAVAPLEIGLRDATAGLLYRKRIVWLVALVFVNVISSGIMARFEATISALVPLVFFLPLLIDSGGNAGSQSATLMVRALALGDVRMSDWGSLLIKEACVSAALGLTTGFVAWGMGLWRGGVVLGCAVGISMFLVVVLGSLIGMCIPLLLNKLKLDPATASSPLITTVIDIVGILLYFSVAARLLGS
ncbi:MAG: magnesium transporter, partial [Acidobacteriota bacterium]|nr:magnesium transporter [Acidobacteriota bacterium]